MEEKKDDENEANNPIPGAPVANIRRQVTCGRCGMQGHTSRNNNCPGRQAEQIAVAPVVAPPDGGQNHEAVEEVDLEVVGGDLQLPPDMLELEGPPEPNGEDIPEELAPIDQEPDPFDDVDMLEWPEVPQLPLPEGVRPEEANMPPFYKPERNGSPNFQELYDVNPNLESESEFAGLFIDEHVIQEWVTNTNIFGRRYYRGWVKRGVAIWDTCVEEFKAFLALIVLTGINKWSNRDEMFRRGEREFPFVHRIMTKKRYGVLMVCWHYLNVDHYRAMTPEEQSAYRRAHPCRQY